MNKIRIIAVGIIMTFFTLTPVHALTLSAESINSERNLGQLRQWITGETCQDLSSNRMLEKIKIISKGIDNDNIFFWRIKSKHACYDKTYNPRGIAWPSYMRQELKLNILTLVSIQTEIFKVEAEWDLRSFIATYDKEISDFSCFQINASYKINENVLLEIGTKRKFFDRIKVGKKVRSRRANGLTLKISEKDTLKKRETDIFFLPIDMTKAHYADEHYQFSYIAGIYSKKFYSSDKYELDLFGLTRKRDTMYSYGVPHCFKGGAELRVSHPDLKVPNRELKKTLRLDNAIRLTCQYHKMQIPAYTNNDLQWEAKLTNCLTYGKSSKLDFDIYMATKAFKNSFDVKKPWADLMYIYEYHYGFYRPRWGLHTMLTQKLSKELTFSLDAVLFFQMIINDRYLLESERDKYNHHLETRFKAATEYKISKNAIFKASLGKIIGHPYASAWNRGWDLEFSIAINKDKLPLNK